MIKPYYKEKGIVLSGIRPRAISRAIEHSIFALLDFYYQFRTKSKSARPTLSRIDYLMNFTNMFIRFRTGSEKASSSIILWNGS
jgi:hypothetical protein